MNYKEKNTQDKGDILEKAIYIATKYHHGQKRKSEDIDYIYHPVCVAVKLLENNMPKNVVCAAFLHDLVEDTEYTLEDVEKDFGKEVAMYVREVTEMPKDKNTWEERKKASIEKTKTLSKGAKCIIASDKINNLLDMKKQIQLYGKEVCYSKFKRGEEKQKWYYTNMYKACKYGMQDNELFSEFQNLINDVFNS